MRSTFKQFLESDQPSRKPVINSNREGTREDRQNINLVAMIRQGFEKNFREMVEEQTWLYRGFSRPQFDYEFDIGKISEPKNTNRKSIYSDYQFVANLWHMFKNPSRARATIATPNVHNARNFGDAYMVVPADGTELNGLPHDWNVGFEDELEEYFGTSASFGDLSSIVYDSADVFNDYYDFKSDVKSELGEMHSALEEIVHSVTYDISKIKTFCDSFDYVLSQVDKEHFIEHVYDTAYIDTRKFYENIIANLNSKKSTFEYFTDFFSEIGNHVIQSKNPVNLIHKTMYAEDTPAEIWWTGKSLIVSPIANRDKLEAIVKLLDKK